VPLFTPDGLGLGLVILFLVLVLRIWSCLHHWCGYHRCIYWQPCPCPIYRHGWSLL